MTFATALILAFSLSMDSFAAALGTGACLRRPGLWEAVRVGACFGGVQLAMPLIGFALGLTFATVVQDIDHWIAFVLLLAVGGKMVWESLFGDEEEDAERAGCGGRTAFGPLLLTAVATSIDAAAVGVSLAVVDVDIVSVCLLIGAVTFGLSSGGVLMGRAAGPLLGQRAELIGGLGLIAIGVKILAEHTLWV
ncbi:manganese efflux pump MntP [Azospirillum isscasi]|uniref:Putative manganese efflux pump MntP n=1 Tax=Azospirillum isscasi TaxID=3053926 RepID=A0ABU0WGN1_9PROT|nr:manganese efflux pump MntP family protein [Azospirillum isscasi]MDQ2103247.1 manganese efflux pump MntP family protein [Azospirillum isscasi]